MSWSLLQNSLLVAGGVVLASGVLGSVAALWVSTLGRRSQQAALIAAAVMLVLPPFLVTNAWLDLAGQTGTWRDWLPFNIFSLCGTIWVLTLLYWPVTLLFTLGGLQRLQAAQLEIEPLLRGGLLIRWLLIPVAWPGLIQAAVITFILAWNNFAVPAVLQTKVFPAEVWVSFNTTFDYWQAVRLSWPLLVLSLVLLALLLPNRVAWPRLGSSVTPRLLRERLGRRWCWTAATMTLAGLFLSLGIPLTQLVSSSQTWAELPSAFAAGQSAVRNSVLFAAAGSTLAVVTGLAVWRWRWGVGLWLVFLVPGVLLGIAMIFLLNRDPFGAFYQSAGMVLLGLGLRYAAISWTGLGHALRTADRRLLDFARMQTAAWWPLFRHGFWPQVAWAAGVVWLLTYLLCLWDVETLILIIPPGRETLALRIFNLLHYGHNSQVNALCLLLLGLAILPVGLWAVVSGVRRWSVFNRSLFLTLVPLMGLLWLSGCQARPDNEMAIESKFFATVQVIGSRGTALGQFNKPRSVAVDASDNLYVVDMTGRVQKFSSNGVYLASWQLPQTEKGKPKGMCRDGDGNIVVIEPHYARMNHFAPDGRLTAQWGSAGTNVGQLCLPRAVAINSRGDLWVCEYTLVDRVQRFDRHTHSATLALGGSGRGPGEFNRPEGIGIDREDHVYVADSCNHRIQVFSPKGRFLRSYGQAGSGVGDLSYPYDIQIDSAGFQFVAEFGNSRVQVFAPGGTPVEVLGGMGSAPGQFSNPWSLALDSAGNLYVADSQNHRVQKLVRKAMTMTKPTTDRLGLAHAAVGPRRATRDQH